MRVVIDINILVSALIAPAGKPAAIVDAWLDGKVTLLTCGTHVAELCATPYEAWFGPNAVGFEGSPSQPLLSSNSMRAAGRPGYDSADPQVLAQHTQWLTAMGVDAVLADLTNGVNAPSWPTGTSSPDGILCLL